MIDAAGLATYLNANEGEDVERALAAAEVLVTQASESAWRPVPEVVRDLCVLRVAENLYAASLASEGGSYTGADGTTVPVANDPLRKARPLLARYVSRV